MDGKQHKICKKWSEFHKNTSINQCIVDFANNLSPNSRVLDIGCGTGYPIALYLSKQGFQVTGIDISEEMIKQAQKLNLHNATFFSRGYFKFQNR